MQLQNSAERFGTVAKALHWAIALLVVVAYALAISLDQVTRSSDPWRRILHFHQWIGFTILFLMIARAYWRLQGRHPDPLGDNRFERRAASIVHTTLYVLLIAMPITGWAGGKMNRTYFNLFEVPSFYNTPLYDLIVTRGLGLTWEQFEAPLDFFHYGLVGPYLLWMLIAAHVGAALFHHFVRRDGTLLRMLPARAPKAAEKSPEPGWQEEERYVDELG